MSERSVIRELSEVCDWCHAQPGEMCKKRDGNPALTTHLIRKDVPDAAPQGERESDPTRGLADRLTVLGLAMRGATLGLPAPDDPGAFAFWITKRNAEDVEIAGAALRAAPSGPTREQVEALRLVHTDPPSGHMIAYNEAVDAVLALFPVPAPTEGDRAE